MLNDDSVFSLMAWLFTHRPVCLSTFLEVQAGADVDARDAEGSRPIDAAAAAGQKAIVKLLLPHMPASQPSSVDEVMASAAASRPASHNP